MKKMNFKQFAVLIFMMGVLVGCNQNSTTSENLSNSDKTDDSTSNWKEEYAYTLGTQAYIYAYSWLYLAELRYEWVGREKPEDYQGIDMAYNQFHHFRKMVDANYRAGGSPNNDTQYSLTFLDLTKEPVIFSHPDMGDRYFTFELASMTSDNFGYIGKRTTGSKAGHFLIAGPNWDGKLPKGVKFPAQANGTKLMNLSATSPTPYVLVFVRTAVNGKDDVKNVVNIQNQYKITPLSQWGKSIEPSPENRNVWKPIDRATDPLADWKTINRFMGENPYLEQNKKVFDLFRRIGIGAGIEIDDLDEATKKGLARAAVSGRILINQMGSEGAFSKKINGWSFPPKTMGSAGYVGDFVTRGAIQCAVGIISNDPQEASYPNTTVDIEGNTLDGKEKYTMTFTSETMPEVGEFWSLTMYDLTYNLVDNPINRYNMTSLSPTFKKGQDGSLTLYIQSEAPDSDKEGNWLPSPKEGAFFMVFRTYLPGKDIVEQTWQIPGLVKGN